ncbi:pimeloyl-ACP methyl ester carboxylesterase [Parvibaculum indicum]|uniref:alpha/beta fold hydrolase n=1 Tax=Parvibaculum indicum TaxID=562969 RepID=UPI00141E4C24|nr:alpha/beta hydrolase [Parvibaculum indicum]NIJ40759.1 pimeloyl-ACP methyl ester carboxylesterase [Parvibaculum indicum]
MAGFEPYETTRKDKDGQEIRLTGHAVGNANGSTVVMLASLGRPGSDFDDLAERLALKGYRVILPEPRGIGASDGPMKGQTLHDLAADVACVIETQAVARPITLLGHAFGNRLARTTAADYPALVSRVILLACGGLIEMPEESRKALIGCFDESLSPDEHIECVRKGFFADGNDPEVWREGWYPKVMLMQSSAVRATDVEDWWEAGGQPMLVMQALDDAIALPANAQDIKNRLGERITLAELPNAGHAMLPEQPEEIARIVATYLEA